MLDIKLGIFEGYYSQTFNEIFYCLFSLHHLERWWAWFTKNIKALLHFVQLNNNIVILEPLRVVIPNDSFIKISNLNIDCLGSFPSQETDRVNIGIFVDFFLFVLKLFEWIRIRVNINFWVEQTKVNISLFSVYLLSQIITSINFRTIVHFESSVCFFYFDIKNFIEILLDFQLAFCPLFMFRFVLTWDNIIVLYECQVATVLVGQLL